MARIEERDNQPKTAGQCLTPKAPPFQPQEVEARVHRDFPLGTRPDRPSPMFAPTMPILASADSLKWLGA